MRCIDCNVELTAENRYLDMDRCLNCALNYRYCPACGGFLPRTNMRAEMCRPCWRENPSLAGCSCRISTVPINLGDAPVAETERTFGCELEVEVSGRGNDPIKKHIKDIDEVMGDRVLMKRDGSLSNGMEIVTRPAPLKKQYALWNDFFSMKHAGMKSFDTKTCGLHIHVGRTGIADAEHTIAKTVCFVNAAANNLFVYLLAGRTSNGYAKLKTDKTLANGFNPGDRYEAVNLTNSNTIEFRIFRGTLKKESLFKALEFCDSILDYCSQAQDLEQSISRTGYVRFVKEQGKWPHLLAFIQARWFGVATKLSERAGWKAHKNCTVRGEKDLALSE